MLLPTPTQTWQYYRCPVKHNLYRIFNVFKISILRNDEDIQIPT